MKITKIEPQVKAKGRYSVFIDDKFAFGLSELGLIQSGLKIGQELSRAEVNSLKEEAQTDKIYHLVLALVARRTRSQWEIEDYLRRKQIEPTKSTEIVSRLKDQGLINDVDFARRWVESRRLLKPISRRKLELELRQKRVSDQIIADVLSKDESDEVEVLKMEIQKKRRQTRYQDNEKLMQYLARQGYGYGDIKQALSE